MLLISRFQIFWLFSALLPSWSHGSEKVPRFLPESLLSGSLPQSVCLCLCLSHALPFGCCVPWVLTCPLSFLLNWSLPLFVPSTVPSERNHHGQESETLLSQWEKDCFKLNHGYQELKTRGNERVRERWWASKRARGEEERKRDRFGKEKNKKGRKGGRYREERAACVSALKTAQHANAVAMNEWMGEWTSQRVRECKCVCVSMFVCKRKRERGRKREKCVWVCEKDGDKDLVPVCVKKRKRERAPCLVVPI